MRLVGYGRVSTDDQALSADNQRQMLAAYAAKQGLELIGPFIDEAISGGKPIRHRPQGSAMVDVLRPGDRIVITKLDRGFRDTIDALQTVRDLREQGVEVIFLDLMIDTSSPMGWTMLGMMALGAEMERARISERVRDAWAYLKRNNQPYASCRPWGWMRKGKGRDARWVEYEPERKLAQKIMDMRDMGYGWEKIASKVAVMGHTKPVKKAGARDCYYPNDCRTLALAAVAGFPVRPQGAAPESATGRKRASRRTGVRQPAL